MRRSLKILIALAITLAITVATALPVMAGPDAFGP